MVTGVFSCILQLFAGFHCIIVYFSEFHIQLENPHVISSDQVWVGTLGKGPDSITLSSAYDTR